MRAEGGAQVQVPNDCYDQRCFAAMFFGHVFFIYTSLSLSLSLKATNTGLSRLRGVYYVPKLSYTY